MPAATDEYLQGYAAFLRGIPLEWWQSPEWKDGWRAAKADSAIQL